MRVMIGGIVTKGRSGKSPSTSFRWAFLAVKSSWGQFGLSQGGFKYLEKSFSLANHRLLGIELLFEDKSGRKIRQSHQSFAADQLDRIDLDFVAMAHGLFFPKTVKWQHAVRAFGCGGDRGTGRSGIPRRYFSRIIIGRDIALSGR